MEILSLDKKRDHTYLVCSFLHFMKSLRPKASTDLRHPCLWSGKYFCIARKMLRKSFTPLTWRKKFLGEIFETITISFGNTRD